MDFLDNSIDPQEVIDLGIYVVQTKGWATILGVSAAALTLLWFFGSKTVRFGFYMACTLTAMAGKMVPWGKPMSVLAKALCEAFEDVVGWQRGTKSGTLVCPERGLICFESGAISLDSQQVHDRLSRSERKRLAKLAAKIHSHIDRIELHELADKARFRNPAKDEAKFAEPVGNQCVTCGCQACVNARAADAQVVEDLGIELVDDEPISEKKVATSGNVVVDKYVKVPELPWARLALEYDPIIHVATPHDPVAKAAFERLRVLPQRCTIDYRGDGTAQVSLRNGRAQIVTLPR